MSVTDLLKNAHFFTCDLDMTSNLMFFELKIDWKRIYNKNILTFCKTKITSLTVIKSEVVTRNYIIYRLTVPLVTALIVGYCVWATVDRQIQNRC